jgi:spermidine synthase
VNGNAPVPGAGEHDSDDREPGWELPRRKPHWEATALLAIVLVIATTGLVYELSIAAVGSYLLGDSVTQFSTVIGVYLSALGLGAYLSRFVVTRVASCFVEVELGAALVGGLSAPGLFIAFHLTSSFRLALYATVLGVGVLVGLELPLLLRILRQKLAFKELVAQALTFDYAGALVGSLAFSLLLVPALGLLHTSILCGLINAAVGLVSTWVLEREGKTGSSLRRQRWLALAVLSILFGALFGAGSVTRYVEASLYVGNVVVAEQSSYQRIVVVEDGGELRLFLNGHLQFSSDDEYRYHEALVHPALAAVETPRRVFIGGGGDGLAAREALRWPQVGSITVVDLDPGVTGLFASRPELVSLNRGALHDPRVTVVNADAMTWLAENGDHFDVMIFDFPDPTTYSLAKLYSTNFYRAALRHLAPGGVVAVQATSPLLARRSYWCIVTTLEASGLHTLPYHVFVPSFGEWGFALAAREKPRVSRRSLARKRAMALRYLSTEVLESSFAFPPDIDRIEAEANEIDSQALVGYYLDEMARLD